jgi:hypothetical protein
VTIEIGSDTHDRLSKDILIHETSAICELYPFIWNNKNLNCAFFDLALKHKDILLDLSSPLSAVLEGAMLKCTCGSKYSDFLKDYTFGTEAGYNLELNVPEAVPWLYCRFLIAQFCHLSYR